MTKLLPDKGCDVAMATTLIQTEWNLIKEPFYVGKLSGEFCEPNRKDKVTRFPSVSYAR